jgi:putative transcriptional regulator
MKKRTTTKLKLNPRKPPKSNWRTFDAMTEKDRHRAALSDPSAPPASSAQLERARRLPSVRALRKKPRALES